MKISFDLDDTLIPSKKNVFPTVRQNIIHKICRNESIRDGTIELIKSLQSQGHSIGIYTTSYRSILKIKWLFFLYNIRLDFIINENINRKILQSKGYSISKHPPSFQIDLHIDDSKGVEMESITHGFKVIIIEQSNTNWVDHVIHHINTINH